MASMSDERENKEFDTLIENISRILRQEDEATYSKEVVEEFRNPFNVGRMDDPDGQGIADGLCGDTMEFYVKVNSGMVEDCSFYTDGCGATIACGSRLARLVAGMDLDEAALISPKDIVSLLNGLPPDHEHCAALAVLALRNALRDYGRRSGREEVRQ